MENKPVKRTRTRRTKAEIEAAESALANAKTLLQLTHAKIGELFTAEKEMFTSGQADATINIHLDGMGGVDVILAYSRKVEVKASASTRTATPELF